MSTVRDVVSRIRSANKFVNSDGLISDRLIAYELKSKSILLIKREANLRKLWNTDTIFTTIPCLQMKEVPLSDCCNYISDRTISRSICKIPRISEGNYEYLIQGVYGLDSSVSIKYTTINRFINRLKLNLKTNDVYYLIMNDYLYVTSPNIRSVKLVAFFEEDIPHELQYPTNCSCEQDIPLCFPNPLDLDFKCPGYLENNVIEMTSKYLKETYLSVDDIKANRNEDTQGPASKT